MNDKTNINEPILTGNDILNGNNNGKYDEKQIEEMAKILKGYCCLIGGNPTKGDCYQCRQANASCYNYAEHIYNAGYRNCKDKVVLSKDEYIENDRLMKLLEEKRLDELKSIHKIFDKTRKETAREILKKGNEYLMQSTDKACAFACFLGIIEHEYGVEIEE